MTDKLTFWLGRDAEPVWQAYVRKTEQDAEQLRRLPEANDE